jgi:hypothetical protein
MLGVREWLHVMTTDTPEPPPSDGPGAPTTPGTPAKAPRVLVSVDDFEDPADWDVIVVENEAVDDDTARRIARQRSGRRAAHTVSLPSLDEHDVIKAFDTDRDAEGPEGVGVDAFQPPEPVPVRRRPSPSAPPAAEDPFAGFPEPGDPEPEPEAAPEQAPEPTPATAGAEPEAPAAGSEDEAPAWDPDAVAPMADPGRHRRAATADADLALGHAPATATPVPPEAAPAEEAPGPAASVDGGSAGPLDDPGDDFYAIGDDGVAPGAEAPAEAGEGWSATAEALDVERELLDDPADDFFDVGPEAEGAEERARMAAEVPGDGERLEVPAWGAAAAATGAVAEGDGAAPPDGDAPATPEDEPAPAVALDEDFEDEVEFDSSFPLGPDDLLVEGELEPVDLDTLDYASVFGPVRGAMPDPGFEEPARRRRPQPTYEDDLYLDGRDEDEDEEDRWVVAPARSRGRRRELIALGIAAGVMIAIGIGSQIYGDGGGGGLEAGDTTTTTAERTRRTSPPTTASALTLPSLPTDTSVEAPVDDGTTGTTARRGTNTTRPPQRTTTTRAPQQTTTTAAQTTTTAPPQTTTTAPTTTAPPPPPPPDGP